MSPCTRRFVSRVARLVIIFFVFHCASCFLAAQTRSGGLQRRAGQVMATHPGALVVVDVTSGKIIAAHRLDLAAQKLERPGSTVKPFLLLALLEAGKINPMRRVFCRRPLLIGSQRMDCTHPLEVKEVNAVDALAYSCNTYFSQVATRFSAVELVQAFRHSGLDSPSGFFAREASGHISLPGSEEDLQLEALGDRGIEVTSLELLAAYRKLALRKRTENPGVAEPVFLGLEDSVKFGMAHAAYIEGMNVAGKTGTASSAESARTHGFFLGYAPAEKPEIALVVYLSHGRGMDAAAVARPIFAEFLAWQRRHRR